MKPLLDFIEKETLTEAVDYNINLKPLVGNLKNPETSLPITPKKFDWITYENPERLVKSFEFKHYKILKAFLNELLEQQEKLGHHATIIVESKTVTIETYTHNVDEVTELDLDLAKFADLLYQDVQYYFLTKRQQREQFINND